MNLTNHQWALIEPLLPSLPRRRDGRGRPWRDDRQTLNGILWILRTGARWKDLPKTYPSYPTCYRRFHRWVETGTLHRILQTLANDLEKHKDIDLEECFIDGSFVEAKKGEIVLVLPKQAKGRKLWQSQTLMACRALQQLPLPRRTKSRLSNRHSEAVSPAGSLVA
jgi:transposase